MKRSKWLGVLILAFTLITTGIFFATPRYVLAEEDSLEVQNNADNKVRSFQKDYFMGLLYKKLSDGKSFLDISGEDYQKRKDINQSILDGTASKKYSLYDRFGGDISFEMYLGEEVVKTGAADKIYTGVAEAAEGELSFGEVVDLIARKDSAYTNIYYQNRPLLKGDTSDPRVNLYRAISGITPVQAIAIAQANYFLGTAKAIVSIVSFLASDKIVTTVTDLLEKIVETKTWDAISTILSIIFFIGGITLVIFALRSLVSWIKQGGYSLKNLIVSLVGTIISFTLITTILASPQSFINLSRTLLSFGDNVVAQTLKDEAKGDEVIESDSLDNVVEATLWKEAIFNPWVKGTFGGVSYNDLYTTYANKGNPWYIKDAAAEQIGDISVPLSNTESAKNWAALAYSCQSLFHINAVDSKDTNKQDTDNSKAWPVASFVGHSTYLYQDDFRWVDASYKVGQYASDNPNKNLDRYVDTRSYNFQAEEGLHALWLAILLIPIGIIGFKKLLAAIKALGMFAVLLFRSCVNVLAPTNEHYYVLGNLKACATPVLDYLFYIVLLAAGISFYKAFGTNDNVLLQLLFLAITLYMCTLNPQRVFETFRPANVKRTVVSVTTDVKDKVEDIAKKRADLKADKIRDKIKETPGSAAELVAKTDNKRKGGTITKEQYLDEEKIKNLPDDNNIQHIYRGLREALNAETKPEIYRAIESHRKSKSNREYDYTYFDIAKTESASDTYLEGGINEDYDAERAKEYRRKRQGESPYRSVEYAKQETLEKRFRERDNLTQKELKKLKREYKHERRVSRANNMQDALNDLTGRKGGSVVPPMVKIYILLALVIVYFLGLIITIIFGM